MIFLVDLSQPDLLSFPVLGGTFYILIEGPASVARVEQVKSFFPDLSLGTVKVAFVKAFTKMVLDKFACDKCEHPKNIVDLRPSAWMLQRHMFPPSVSRAVIQRTPFDPEARDKILKMILDCMCAIVNGICISPDEFPVLAHIQGKFGELLEIGNDFEENFDPFRHSVFCKPREHVWARMDPSGKFRWPVSSKRLELFRNVIERISFEELVHLADHEEIVSANFPAPVESNSINDHVLPVEVRQFVCSRASSNDAFSCLPSLHGSPEFVWVKDATSGVSESESVKIDLLIETRTDVRAQVGVLSEFFDALAPGGMVYFKHPDTALTVMISTWSTSVPLGSLHASLAGAYENFAQFAVCADGSLWIQKRDMD